MFFALFFSDGGCCCCDNKNRTQNKQVVGLPSQKYKIIARRKSMENVCCIYYWLGATFRGAIVLAGGMKGKTFDFLPPHVQLEFIIYGLAVRWIRK